MNYTQAQLDALATVIDSLDDVSKLGDLPFDPALPDEVRGLVIFAARACRQLRGASADAIAAACEGNTEVALSLIFEAEQYLGTMRERLAQADDLKGTGL